MGVGLKKQVVSLTIFLFGDCLKFTVHNAKIKTFWKTTEESLERSVGYGMV